MNEKTREEKLLALALTMPEYDDFVVKEYREKPALALEMIQDEFQEYVKTNDIRCFLSTLRKVAEAKGWSELSRKTGLPRSTLYAALSGETDPRISTVMKILNALGIEVLTNIIPFSSEGIRQSLATKNNTEEIQAIQPEGSFDRVERLIL
ncbi:MAG: putative addiction module antidote protein [Synergistaceae bacterium]|jgi:probable addiction module antidote protein|nr:putative addiction module antidote protein [Synergistaceae bacterium]